MTAHQHDLELQIATLEADVRRLESAMMDGEMRLAVAAATADDYRGQLASRTAELQERQEDLARVVGSKSWALTAPLRRMRRPRNRLLRRAIKVTYWTFTFQLRQRLREHAARTSAAWDAQAAVYRVIAASGLFDSAFYVASYPDVVNEGFDPLSHYMNRGAARGYDPNPLFDTSFYRQAYAEHVADGINPVYDYIVSGAARGSNPNPCFDSSRYLETHNHALPDGTTPLADFLSIPDVAAGIRRALRDGVGQFGWTEYRRQYVQSTFCYMLQRQFRESQQSKELGGYYRPTIVVAVDDAADAGLHALELVNELLHACDAEVVVLLEGSSPHYTDFVRLAPTVLLDETGQDGQPPVTALDDLCALLRKRGADAAICTSSATGDVAERLKSNGFRVVSTVHELPTRVRVRGSSESLRRLFDISDHVVFPSEHVQRQIASELRLTHASARVVFPGLPRANAFLGERDYARFEVTKQLELNPDAYIVLGRGRMAQDAGFDLFIQMASSLHGYAGDRIHFVWVGEPDGDFTQWCLADAEQLGVGQVLHTPEHRIHASLLFAAADVYAFTARDDALATGCLEAIEARVPIVAFDTAGIAELLGQRADALVPYPNVDAMAVAVASVIDTGASRAKSREPEGRRQKEGLYLTEYVRSLMHLATSSVPVEPLEPARAADGPVPERYRQNGRPGTVVEATL